MASVSISFSEGGVAYVSVGFSEGGVTLCLSVSVKEVWPLSCRF